MTGPHRGSFRCQDVHLCSDPIPWLDSSSKTDNVGRPTGAHGITGVHIATVAIEARIVLIGVLVFELCRECGDFDPDVQGVDDLAGGGRNAGGADNRRDRGQDPTDLVAVDAHF